MRLTGFTIRETPLITAFILALSTTIQISETVEFDTKFKVRDTELRIEPSEGWKVTIDMKNMLPGFESADWKTMPTETSRKIIKLLESPRPLTEFPQGSRSIAILKCESSERTIAINLLYHEGVSKFYGTLDGIPVSFQDGKEFPLQSFSHPIYDLCKLIDEGVKKRGQEPDK
jgi:hypothetical protein